jgi:hypothetical protein
MRTTVLQSDAKKPARKLASKFAVLVASAALAIGWQSPLFAQVSDSVLIRGTAGPTCTLNIAESGSQLTLPITTAGIQTVTVGTVQQTCNNPTGYRLTVTTTNCTVGTAGAKLSDGAGHTLNYSINFDNPPAGVWDVTALAASACTNQVARTVGTTVTAEDSAMAVVFTGNTALYPGTYEDTITVTLTTI